MSRSLRFVTTEALLSMPRPSYLIDGIMERNSFNVLYGAPGTGKSFLALDMALHIATGRPWLDHEVRQGAVIYVAAEGYQSMARRVSAWLEFYGLPLHTLRDLNWVIEPVPLLGGVATLNQFLLECVGSLRGDSYEADEEGSVHVTDESAQLELVVFDTMSRCIQGADENDAKDMGSVVQWLDQLRDHEFTNMSTSTLVVHHSTKTGATERGSSVLRGATDTMMFLKKDAHGPVLVCNKQKNDEPFGEQGFRIHQLPSGDAIIVSRAALRAMKPTDAELEIQRAKPATIAPAPKLPQLGVRQKRFMAALSVSSNQEGMRLTEIARTIQIPVPSAFKVRKSLQKLNYIYKDPETSRSMLTMDGAERLVVEKILKPEDIPDDESELASEDEPALYDD